MPKRTINLTKWTKKYDRVAKKQGWSLFDADGLIEILKIDEPENSDKKLKSDMDALKLVITSAGKGDEMCLMALFLDGKSNRLSDRREADYVIP